MLLRLAPIPVIGSGDTTLAGPAPATEILNPNPSSPFLNSVGDQPRAGCKVVASGDYHDLGRLRNGSPGTRRGQQQHGNEKESEGWAAWSRFSTA